MNSRKTKELLTWLLFSAGFSLGPLYANWIYFREKPDFHWYRLCQNGELYLVAGVLAADAISRILRKRTKLGYFDIVIGAACVFFLFGSTMEYGMAAPGLLNEFNHVAMSETQSVLSIYYFGWMVVAGAASIL